MSATGALERIFATLHTQGAAWKAEAARRRQLTAVDPAADVLEHCAAELALQVADLEAGLATLTVYDMARIERVQPQTVRNWIRRGELAAVKTADGYAIPRTARRRVA
jgi:hypothetical protein